MIIDLGEDVIEEISTETIFDLCCFLVAIEAIKPDAYFVGDNFDEEFLVTLLQLADRSIVGFVRNGWNVLNQNTIVSLTQKGVLNPGAIVD